MKIIVGSTNPIKVEAVREVILNYDFLCNAAVTGIEVHSEVSHQPKSLEETVRGARNRARNAFNDCAYSFGIESGIIEVPYTRSGMLDLCGCVIYDGRSYFVGLSSAFECPPEVTRLIVEEGLDMNQAFNRAGLTDNLTLGSAEGAVGLLTKGRITRKDYTKQAIMMALINIENVIKIRRKRPTSG